MEPASSEQFVEEVDVEEYVKAGTPIPRAHRYRIRIDRDTFVVTVPSMTGREILAVAGKTPEQYLLRQRLRGGVVLPVEPDAVVSFVEPGVERFMTLPKDTTEG
jgi:Multiubiquitin